jgi:hypothetical protein
MESGPKLAIGSATVLLLVLGGLVWRTHYKNTHDTMVVQAPLQSRTLTADDYVYPRHLHPDSMNDARDLTGKTIWVSAGGQLDYYKDSGNHVDYAKPAGTLPGAEPLAIKGAFEEVAPASGRAVARIPAGKRQVLLAFTLPKSGDAKTLYATPVAYFDDGVYTFFSDQIFFYDDPHQLYKWGPEMWAHIDKHEAVQGMTEDQAMMSLGEVTRPSSDDAGNRSVWFDNDGHPVTIVFADGKATSITPSKE